MMMVLMMMAMRMKMMLEKILDLTCASFSLLVMDFFDTNRLWTKHDACYS